jgi:hypothetical protein
MPDPEMSPTLFLAILSMDSYNRGYNVGLELTGNSGRRLATDQHGLSPRFLSPACQCRAANSEAAAGRCCLRCARHAIHRNL